MHPPMKSLLLSPLLILPSVVLGIFLSRTVVPVQYGYYVCCTVLLLAVFDFATVIFVDQYRDSLGRATIPALLGTIAVILLFVIIESLNRFFFQLGYGYLTPFVVAALLLTYAAIFIEKNTLLKVYISINSLALVLLWTTGITGRVAMPF